MTKTKAKPKNDIKFHMHAMHYAGMAKLLTGNWVLQRWLVDRTWYESTEHLLNSLFAHGTKQKAKKFAPARGGAHYTAFKALMHAYSTELSKNTKSTELVIRRHFISWIDENIPQLVEWNNEWYAEGPDFEREVVEDPDWEEYSRVSKLSKEKQDIFYTLQRLSETVYDIASCFEHPAIVEEFETLQKTKKMSDIVEFALKYQQNIAELNEMYKSAQEQMSLKYREGAKDAETV